MKTLSDPFELTPEILQGMDGAHLIPQNVASFTEHDVWSAGDGVDCCIHSAMFQANRQHEPAAEVLHHLKYQRDQLSILIRNLESLPDANKPLWDGSPWVWVVGFVGESTGGFEWGTNRKAMDRFQKEWRDAGHDVSPIRTVYLDSLNLPPGHLDHAPITEALDKRPDLWEPPSGDSAQYAEWQKNPECLSSHP